MTKKAKKYNPQRIWDKETTQNKQEVKMETET